LVIPDPSVLLKALDNITEKVIKKDQRKSFRIETLREQLKVDVIPTYKAVESLTTFIEAELEESVNTTQPNPKVKSINSKDDRKGKGPGGGKESDKGDAKGSKGKNDSKGKGKTKSDPCKYFSLDEGCRFGQTCKAYHKTLKPEDGKCYICGSKKHQAFECDRPKRSPSATSGKGDGKKGKKSKGDSTKGPTIKPVKPEGAGESEAATPQRELRQEGSDPKEPEREPEKILENFQTMMIKALKEKGSSTHSEELDTLIGSLKKKLDVKIQTIKVRKVIPEKRYGLLDSGATNNVREIKDGEEDLSGVVPIDVEVAFEGTVNTQLFMNKEGTILTPKGTEAIVFMNLLVKELGYKVEWEEEKDIKVTSREGKALEVEVVNGTPMLLHEDCLRLIFEIEEKKKKEVKSVRTQTEEEFKIGSIWTQMKDLITWLMRNNVMKGIELLNM